MILDPATAAAKALQGTRRGPPPTLAMLRRFELAPLRKIGRSAELALVRDMRELGRLPLPRLTPKRRHSRDGSIHCELCAPLRCAKAP